MNYFITYANEPYAKSRKFTVKMAKRCGKFDKTIEYTPKDIDTEFYNKYKHILEIKRGNGLWLWKPYLLLKTLMEVNDGDIVFYMDSGAFFFRNCKGIIKSMSDDIWVSNIPLIEKQWTKPELFEIMNCVGERFTDTNQVQASFIAVKKTERGLAFVKEWLEYCCMNNTLGSDSVDAKAQPDYIEHREDQSVLSLLVKKWDIKPHKDPTQYGKLPIKYYSEGRIFRVPANDDTYKPCIILHRGTKPKISVCFMQWLCCILPKNISETIIKWREK